MPLLPDVTIGLASILAKGTVLLALTAGMVWVLRHRAAAYRHAVWAAGLGLLLLLPLTEGLLPGWGIPGPAAVTAPSSQVVSAESGPQGPSPANRSLSSDSGTQERAAKKESSTRSAAASPEGHGSSFGPVGWKTLMQIFVGTWALGVAVVLGGTVLGLLRSHRRVQRASRLAQDDWAAPLEWARRQLGVDRPVRLSCSPEVSVPMTFGLVRPTILLPASARQWSRERRQTVLLHELAHVQRGDFVANLVAQCACALHWVNPLAWYAAGRLRFERERACDDCVLGTGLPPTDYADHLLSVAREAHGTASFQAALTMAAPSTFRQRVESLLSGAVPTATPSRKQTILLALPLLAVTLVLGAARPVSSAAGGGSAPAAALPVRTDTTACDPAGTFPPTTDRFQAACERRTYRLPPAEALALRSGEYGPVVVEAWDAPTVALEATIVTRRPDRSAAEGALSQVRVDVEGDTVRASGPADDAPGWWSVGYRLRVPRSIALDLATYSGRIQVRDVAGSLRLTSDHGALSVTLPAGAGADLRARTDYGEIDVGFPVTVTGPISEQLTTTVGEGGPPVRLETGDDIMIRRTDGSGSGAS